MPLPKALARFNRVVTNRVLGVLAPWLPPFAVIVHRGRSSGHVYRTPVWTFRRDGRLVVALTYSSDTDWIRNLFAEGGGRVLRFGREHTVTAPQLIRAESGRGLVPALIVPVLRAIGVHEFLVLELGS